MKKYWLQNVATSKHIPGLELPDCPSGEVQSHPQLLLHFVGSQVPLWGNAHANGPQPVVVPFRSI